MAQLEKKLNLAKKDEIPQQFTSAEMTEIKNAISQETVNVNITPYHIYDEDEHTVGEWRQMVDGVKKQKPVYERTIIISYSGKPPKDENDVYTLTDYAANIDRAINASCTTISNNRSNKDFNAYGNYIARTDGNNIKIVNLAPYSASGTTEISITFSYTKTTDEWEVV